MDNFSNHQRAIEEGKSQEENLFDAAEELLEENVEESQNKENIEGLARELINLYDNPFFSTEKRNKAASIVVRLANRYEMVQHLVIDNAKQFARSQHISDAFPYNPNSFDVLSKLKSSNIVIAFLKNVIKIDWGIPRWEALSALSKLDDPEANEFIVDVVRGKYPPKKLGLKEDLRQIRDVKGQSFIDKYISQDY